GPPEARREPTNVFQIIYDYGGVGNGSAHIISGTASVVLLLPLIDAGQAGVERIVRALVGFVGSHVLIQVLFGLIESVVVDDVQPLLHSLVADQVLPFLGSILVPTDEALHIVRGEHAVTDLAHAFVVSFHRGAVVELLGDLINC